MVARHSGLGQSEFQAGRALIDINLFSENSRRRRPNSKVLGEDRGGVISS
jgi:hypothetical protein